MTIDEARTLMMRNCVFCKSEKVSLFSSEDMDDFWTECRDCPIEMRSHSLDALLAQWNKMQ